MTEILEIYNYVILTWMALMLTIQSYILWKLLPEIKTVVANTEIGKRIFEDIKPTSDSRLDNIESTKT